MTRIGQSPFALKVAGVAFLAGLWVPAIFDHGDAAASIFIGAVLLTVAPVVFMLRGSRIAWVLTLLLAAGGIVGVALNGSWWDVLVRVLPVPFLLAPESRIYAWDRQAQRASEVDRRAS